jgi:hypothetical protein
VSEYPGVFVEEVSYRSKAIEGVPASLGAFVFGILVGLLVSIAADRARRRRHPPP